MHGVLEWTLPVIAEVRLERPRAAAETTVVNFMVRIVGMSFCIW